MLIFSDAVNVRHEFDLDIDRHGHRQRVRMVRRAVDEIGMVLLEQSANVSLASHHLIRCLAASVAENEPVRNQVLVLGSAAESVSRTPEMRGGA